MQHLNHNLSQDKSRLTWLAVVLGSLPIVSYGITSYRAWLRLEPGGLPHNVFGWLVNSALHIVARSDTKFPAPYNLSDLEAIYGPYGAQSYFDGEVPPARAGPRPDVPGTVAPQRQMSERVTAEILQKMKDFFVTFSEKNAGAFRLKPSALEGPSQKALFLADDVPVPKHMKGTGGEFAHHHGWAERHKLSGRMLPWGFVLVYAPRNDEELMIWKSIIVASATFVTSAVDGLVVQTNLPE